MKPLTHAKLLTITLLGIGSLRLGAQQISGSYSNDCGGMVQLWDLSGNYFEDNGMESESMTLNMDAKGMITGQGHFNITDDWDDMYLDGDFGVNGKVTSAGSVTRVNLTLKVTSGTGSVQGYNVGFSITLNDTFEVDGIDRQLVGSSRGKLRLTLTDYGRSATRSIPPAPTVANLPDSVDGNWGLSVNMAPTGTKYGGSSAIYLSNGKSINLGVSGTYSARTGVSKISLKSPDTSTPANLTIAGSCPVDTLIIQSLKGKILGQNLVY